MRIIAGQHRGLSLAHLGKGDGAAHLRPTTDRVRENLFNLLAGRGLPQGVRVLDLFAGTGALGLEALSRGAIHATFVDNGRIAQRLIRQNLQKAKRENDAKLLTCAAQNLPKAATACELIFLDPPYGKNLGLSALETAEKGGWIAKDATIVWEESTPQAAPGFTTIDYRRYGETHLTLLQRNEPP